MSGTSIFWTISSTVRPGWHAGLGDDERHMDVGIAGDHLARHQAGLAHVIAVVGGEHEIGIVRRADRCDGLLQLTDHSVDGQNRLGAVAETIAYHRHVSDDPGAQHDGPRSPWLGRTAIPEAGLSGLHRTRKTSNTPDSKSLT
jgi:hypothetical protein